MSSAARSSSRETLSGPVAVCVDRPLLALDRPFTYRLDPGLGAGVGSLVQVPFHRRSVRGWVLGPTEDVPARMLEVRRLVSPVRFFDASMLEVLRWVAERYVAPLATVIARAVPPRVASEESDEVAGGAERLELRGGRFAPSARSARLRAPALLEPLGVGASLSRYEHGADLLGGIAAGRGTFVVRPDPLGEAQLAVACVAAALDAGRSAVVLVPEVEPLPATARAVLDAFSDDAALFAGGDRRERYRTWLEILGGRYRIVVGTRPAVFAPVPRLGLVYVARESHGLHREERSPYYHVRDVALARGRLQGAVTVMAAVFPSLEAQATQHVDVAPRGRRWPPVEVVRPGPEGRAPRLVRALGQARRAFLFSPLPGYGVARVCRACGEPASCAACGGVLRAEAGEVRCATCGSLGVCANCGGSRFGIARGGAERVEEWARGIAAVPVHRVGRNDPPRPPGEREVLVGGVEEVKDLGPLGLDLVAVLDADLASRRPGLAARERALATWFEAAAWAMPGGRVIVQSRSPNDPAVQALVTGRPERFARAEAPRRAEAGFPVGGPVFRVSGTADLEPELQALGPRTLLSSVLGDETICLLALDPGDAARVGRGLRTLAERGVVTRVEAEPHL